MKAAAAALKVPRATRRHAAEQPVAPSSPAPGDAAADWVSIDDLEPWAKNPKRLSAEKLDEAVTSLRTFGFGSPGVRDADTAELIAGNTRLKGMRKILGDDPLLERPENATLRASLTGPSVRHIPIRRMCFPSDAHREAYSIRDNNQIGEWDSEQLVDMVSRVSDAGIEIEALGFASEEVLKMLEQSAVELDGDVNSATGAAIRGKFGKPEAPGPGSIRTVMLAYSAAEHEEFVRLVKAQMGAGKLGPASVVLQALRAVPA